MSKKPVYPCPHCQKPADLSADNAFRPFCCERCRLIDLGTWACEGYQVSGQGGPSEEDLELLLEQADRDPPLH